MESDEVVRNPDDTGERSSLGNDERSSSGKDESPCLSSSLKRVVSLNDIAAFHQLPAADKYPASEAGGDVEGTSWEDAAGTHIFTTKKLVLVMVGLPARGKTYMAHSLARYLNWLGFKTKEYNVGMHRRTSLGGKQSSEFFDAQNADGIKARWKLALECLDEMIQWLLEEGGMVGIFDATNTTVERRRKVWDKLVELGIRVLFVESVCEDEQIIERNILATKLFSPDYKGKDPEEAVNDFKKRIANYEKVYQTLGSDERDLSYIKVIDVGDQIVMNRIRGYIPGKIVAYLVNSHLKSHTLYLSRHGESAWNACGKLGGDPELTERGLKYSAKLEEYMRSEFTNKGKPLPLVWTSQLKRTRQTVQAIPTISLCMRALNEIDAGVCEGMSYAEIKEQMPDVHRARSKDKLRFRYPGGESYVDVIHRLERVILELERQTQPVLLVAHNAVIRCIYAYYMGISTEQSPTLDIPLHTVFKIIPRAYNCSCERVEMDVDSANLHSTPEKHYPIVDAPGGSSLSEAPVPVPNKGSR